ncbi:glutamate ABC transporter substrate-binding protein [Leifsonia sp. McL0607]|uniref:glutamate ABC transporter substrate-binding protein n=1 Tax=Leifsonia sp. McL0607 TaxID=3415672 RepID=UPI003CF3DAEF
MKKRHLLAPTLVALAALSLSACSADTTGEASSESGLTYTVVKNVDLVGSPTYDAAKKAGTVRIGVKEDQPGLGYLDAATGKRSGFDIEVARWIAASLGFDDSQVQYRAIPSANREAAIVNDDIDFYVGTYSITDKRKEQIGFAGPYLVTGQGLLVVKGEKGISSEADLAGKTVCSATGSTPVQNIKQNFPDTRTTEFDTYSQCVTAMLDGKADAVTTDQAILIGYAAQRPDELAVVGEPFSVEKYGIGVAKEDAALRHFINATLTDGGAQWKAIYEATLGKSGTTISQPPVDDYS